MSDSGEAVKAPQPKDNKRKRTEGDDGGKKPSFGKNVAKFDPSRKDKRPRANGNPGTGSNKTMKGDGKKKSQKVVKEVPKVEKKPGVELPGDISTPFGRFRAAVARAANHNRTKLSALELEDSLVTEDNVIESKYVLESFAELIKDAVPSWKSYGSKEKKDKKEKGLKGNGVVPVLFIGSTTRCLKAQKVARAEDFPLAKLFARHMKIEEQIEFLKEKRSLLGIGTPDRVLKLASDGHLNLDAVQLFVLDGTVDMKGFTILDGPTFQPCLDLVKSVFRGEDGAEKTARFVWLE